MRVASFCFTCFSQIVCWNEWEEEKKWEDRPSKRAVRMDVLKYIKMNLKYSDEDGGKKEIEEKN